jgi:hypothetical protein
MVLARILIGNELLSQQVLAASARKDEKGVPSTKSYLEALYRAFSLVAICFPALFSILDAENALLDDIMFLTTSVTKASKPPVSPKGLSSMPTVTIISCTMGVQSVEISQQRLSQTTN